MGLLIAALFAALAMLGLWLSGRCTGPALQICAVAVLLALAGYGWQGNPAMPGKPIPSTVR
jgi:cytochrome c-type biogenesis protein CcmH